jgi:poly-gamma-glutamate synthesis protein (capsule biosynthesis protein)
MKFRLIVRVLALVVIAAVSYALIVQNGYLIERDDEPGTIQSYIKEDSGSKKVIISAVGDVALGQDSRFSYTDSFDHFFEKMGGDYGYFFSNVAEILGKDDLTIANLETALSNGGTKAEKYDYGNNYWFNGKPEYANILKAGSIEAVSLANNHSHDFGTGGYDETRRALGEAGIKYFGYSETLITYVNGVRVGLAGFNQLGEYEQGRDANELKQEVEETIKKLSEESDLVVASFHWGSEYKYRQDRLQTELAYLAVDSGADLVIGSHPHVLQPIEKYNDRYIAYSLGNFCFGGNKKPNDFDTAIIRQEFVFDEENSLVKIREPEIIPCTISSVSNKNDYRPSIIYGESGNRIFAKLEYEPPLEGQELTVSVNKNDMVRLDSVANDVVIGLKYATSDNITGKPVYESNIAYLRRGTADKLRKANEIVKEHGCRIKVWDAYRSEKDHKLLFETAKNSYYFIDARIGSNHTRGAAVDVTLVDDVGNELDMPSKFDEMSEKAHRTYKLATPEQKRNALILEEAMKQAGFIPLENEWWHFDDSEYKSYDFIASLPEDEQD